MMAFFLDNKSNKLDFMLPWILYISAVHMLSLCIVIVYFVSKYRNVFVACDMVVVVKEVVVVFLPKIILL